MGVYLTTWLLSGSADNLARVQQAAEATITRPQLDLMWAAAGSVFVALHLCDATGESAFQNIIERAARHLEATLAYHPTEAVWAWTQDYKGPCARYLGAVHGFAGNVQALLAANARFPGLLKDETLRRCADTFLRSARTGDGRYRSRPSTAGS
jgi:hypothetical protein